MALTFFYHQTLKVIKISVILVLAGPPNHWLYHVEIEEEILKVQSKIDGLSMSVEIGSNLADFLKP